MRRVPRRLALWGGALAIAGGGFAFMASNTIHASYVGDSAQVVSGYTVYTIGYSGVPLVGNPGHTVGTMVYIGTVNGNMTIAHQDGVTTVTFKLSPDNAHWAAVQLYNHTKAIIGGGGASNCSENLTTRVWTCNVGNVTGTTGPVPGYAITYIDVEAAS